MLGCYMICPNCQTPVQKIKGCDHMNCPECQKQFCYICGSEWCGHSPNSQICRSREKQFCDSVFESYMNSKFNIICPDMNVILKIFVKTINGKTISIQIMAIATIYMLKMKVSLMTSVEQSNIHLFYGKKVLLDCSSLYDIGIKNGDTLFCLRRQIGGK